MRDSVTSIVNGHVDGAHDPRKLDEQGASETVLILDDEPRLLNAFSVILRKHGYIVLQARTGADALIQCQQCPTTIDLLLADVVLAGMSGPQVAARLMALRPDMKLIYVSGHAANPMLASALHASGTRLLQKPITPELLIRHVREVLATARKA